MYSLPSVYTVHQTGYGATVFGSVDIAVLRQGQLHNVVVLFLAEQYADCWFFKLTPHVAVEVIDVHQHLPEVLVLQFGYLKVDDDVALEQPVIEDEIYIEGLFVKRKPLLPRLE